MDLKWALQNVREIHPETPLILSERLSQEIWVQVFLKIENEDPVGSYKWRWAGNAMASLRDSDKENWVITASAWNHAQWVALASSRLKIPATIVMPETAPKTKITKTQQIWWDYTEVKLYWDNFNEALSYSNELQRNGDKNFIHPFDSHETVMGQATVWLELFNQMKEKKESIWLILVWNGWGWLIAWTNLAVQHMNSDAKVIWVEPENAASMTAALHNKGPIEIESKSTIADWARVSIVWEIWYQSCVDSNNQIIQSPEWRLCTTLLEMYWDRVILEWAGTLWVDGLKSIDPSVLQELKDNKQSIVVVLSWWNMDPGLYNSIQEQSLRYLGLKKDYIITFPQKENALKEFTQLLPNGIDISNFNFDEKNSSFSAPGTITLSALNKNLFIELELNIQKGWFYISEIK